jgi:hypothetical protein
MIILTDADQAVVEDWIKQYRARLITKPSFPNYGRWVSMRQRCRNPNCDGWRHYGGRGIYIVPRWDDFLVYFQDIGIAPELGGVRASLNRIDNDGPYSPENIEWAWPDEQRANRRKFEVVTGNASINARTAGIIKHHLARGRSISWTAAQLGVSYQIVHSINNGRTWKTAPEIEPGPAQPSKFHRRI